MSIIIFFSILSVFLPVLFVFLQNSNKIVSISEHENFTRLNRIIKWESEDEIAYASINLHRLVADDTVKKLLARRDRPGLLEYLKWEYNFIQDRNIHFHFHLPDGTSFFASA